MNTKMLSQLEVMDAEMLAKVEGGYSSTDCRNALITGVTTGIITGGTGAGRSRWTCWCICWSTHWCNWGWINMPRRYGW